MEGNIIIYSVKEKTAMCLLLDLKRLELITIIRQSVFLKYC